MWSMVGPSPLSTLYEIFISIIAYTVIICSLVGLIAGGYAVYHNIYYTNYYFDQQNINVLQYKTNQLYMLYLPLMTCLLGGITSFIQCSMSTLFIALLTISVDYTMYNGVALGFGIIQSIVLCYIHTGKIEFVHR